MSNYQQELSSIIKSNLFIHKEYLFYALFVAELDREFTDNNYPVDTAALVSNLDGGLFKLCFNINFWNSLKTEEKGFLLLHELKHYTNKHYLSSKLYKWNNNIANIAQDLYINHEIIDECNNEKIKLIMPKGGLTINSYPNLNLLPSKDSKYYYDELIKAKEKKDQTGSSGDLNFDKDCDKDIHPTWNNITQNKSDLELKSLEKSVNMQLIRTAKEVEKQQGTVPVNINNYLNSLQNKEETVPWQVLFKRFIGYATDYSIRNTRSKPNKRFEANPGFILNTKVNCAFLYDSSGSVSDDELQECLAELSIIDKKGGNVYSAAWDADCDSLEIYKNSKNLKRTKSGGTDANSALLEVNKMYKKLKLSLAVITTDGYISPITVKCNIPILILITKNGTLKFENKYNYKVIKMK